MVGPIQSMDGYLLPASNIFAGDLMTLEPPTQLIQWACGPTPMNIERLLLYLSSHPDKVHNTFTLTSLMAQYVHNTFTLTSLMAFVLEWLHTMYSHYEPPFIPGQHHHS